MSHPTVSLIYAHPYAERSLANSELLKSIDDLPFVDRRALYDLYPDFDIDVETERKRLQKVDLIVLQHPIYWYSMPPLLKLWVDEVLGLGWAYGQGGDALKGKRMQWVVTTGGEIGAYSPGGPHGHPFDAFVAPVSQTARFCGMEWSEPLVVHDAHGDQAIVADAGRIYRERLLRFAPPPASHAGSRPRVAPHIVASAT